MFKTLCLNTWLAGGEILLMLCYEGSIIQLLRLLGKSLNYCHLTGGLFSISLFTGRPYNLKMDLVTAKVHLAKELFLFLSALALAQARAAAKPCSSCHPKFNTNLLSGTICASFSCFAVSRRLLPGWTGPTIISHSAVRDCWFILVQRKLSSAQTCAYVND